MENSNYNWTSSWGYANIISPSLQWKWVGVRQERKERKGKRKERYKKRRNQRLLWANSRKQKWIVITVMQHSHQTMFAFEVRRKHTFRVASPWMLYDFRVWAPSWTGWPLASISCRSFESRWLSKVLRFDLLRSGCHEIFRVWAPSWTGWLASISCEDLEIERTFSTNRWLEIVWWNMLSLVNKREWCINQ